MGNIQENARGWAQLALVLLAQTATVAAFVYGMKVEIDYLKRDLIDAQADRKSIHVMLDSWRETWFKAAQCDEQVKEVAHRLEKLERRHPE